MPCVSTYLPATQSWQTASSCAPLAGEYLPGLQATHSAGSSAPVVVPYLPAAQSTHPVDRSALVYLPATQSVHPSAAATEYLPAGGVHARIYQHRNTPSLRPALHGGVRDWLNACAKATRLAVSAYAIAEERPICTDTIGAPVRPHEARLAGAALSNSQTSWVSTVAIKCPGNVGMDCEGQTCCGPCPHQAVLPSTLSLLGGHMAQAELPSLSLKVPGGHGLQLPGSPV